MPTNKTVYWIEEDESGQPAVHRATLQGRVAGFDAIATQYVNNKPIAVPMAFQVDDLWIKASVLRNRIILSAQLPGLTLNTKFILQGGKLLPKFDGAPNAIQATPFWKAPANMKLYFAVHVMLDEGYYRAVNPYLWALHGTVAGHWRLPLPNVYDEMRVCLGDPFFEIRHKDLPSMWKACYGRFVNSSWNADLLANKMALAQAMFQFSPLDNSSIDTGPGWNAWCARASNTVVEEALAP